MSSVVGRRRHPCLTEPEWRRVCLESHVRRRAAERYGLELTAGDVAEWSRKVREFDPETARLKEQGRGRVWVALRIGRRWYPAVFDERSKYLVTFLPPEALEPYRGVLSRVPKVGRSGRPAPAEVADVDARMARLALERQDIQRHLGMKLVPPPERGRMDFKAWRERAKDRLAAIQVECARLRAERTRMYYELSCVAGEIDDPTDPHSLLRAATAAMESMGSRLGFELTEAEQGTLDAVRAYLRGYAHFLEMAEVAS